MSLSLRAPSAPAGNYLANPNLNSYLNVLPTRTASRSPFFRSKPLGGVQIRAVVSGITSEMQCLKVGAGSTGTIPASELLGVVESAAKVGAEVVKDAVNEPRSDLYITITNFDFCIDLLNFVVHKSVSSIIILLTYILSNQILICISTDKSSESAILEVVEKNFKDHLILGEEGGLVGNSSSDYLWCIDPLGCGAFCNGQKIHVSQTNQVQRSLLVTGFSYEHDDPWLTNLNLFKLFTDRSRGVRRLGTASADLCHIALGIVDAYWEYRLKPWDIASGALVVEEAGGAVTKMDGGKFTVFYRSILASNAYIHQKIDERV